MIGKRVEWDGTTILNPGEYAKHPRLGTWFACSPNDHLADLFLHRVTEHADGTITVQPSIGIGDTFDDDGKPLNNLYHGFIIFGVWKTL